LTGFNRFLKFEIELLRKEVVGLKDMLRSMDMNWQKLPIEQATMNEIIISGNGKDCEVKITTNDPERTLIMMMRDPRVDVDVQGKVATHVFNKGDMDLGIKYSSAERIKLEIAEIDFPGEDDEWQTSLEKFDNGDPEFLGWMIQDVKLKLSPIEA